MTDLGELTEFLPWQVYLAVGLAGFVGLCILSVRGWTRIARRMAKGRGARENFTSGEDMTPLRFVLGLGLVLLLVMVTVFCFYVGLYGYVGGA